MREYAFDIKLDAVARVEAASFKEAVEMLQREMTCIELGWSADGVELTEATMNEEPTLYEVDGEDAVTCPGCGAVEGEDEWGTVGDGFDGYCPSCADEREEQGVYDDQGA